MSDNDEGRPLDRGGHSSQIVMDQSSSLSIPDVSDLCPLDAALTYAESGWYVIPCAHGTKNPGSILGKDWQGQSSRDPEQIARWWQKGPDYGIALHAGRSGVVVLDIDRPTQVHPTITRALTETAPPFQSSRRGQPGKGHAVFLMPPGRDLGNSTGALEGGWGEVRGRNGVIMAAPSVHEDATQGDCDGYYEWQTVGVVPVLPAYVADLLRDALESVSPVTLAAIEAFLDGHQVSPGSTLWEAAAGRHLSGHVAAFGSATGKGAARHVCMVGHLCGALKEARDGLLDARTAADTLESVFLAAAARSDVGSGRPRAGREACVEWADMLAFAVAAAGAATPGEARARADARDEAWRERRRAEEALDGPRAAVADQGDSWLGDNYGHTDGAPPAVEPWVDVPEAPGPPDPGAEDAARHERLVQAHLAHLLVQEDARELLRKSKLPPLPMYDVGTLTEQLAKPEPPAARVEGLIPWDASTLILAQRKAGKTTMTLNLARALLTDERFLGRFSVRPVEGRIALLNFEVSGAQIARWARDVGVPPDRFVLVNLRGARNPFADPEAAAALAETLRAAEVESLIVDPFGRAFTGETQNDAGQVQKFLVGLDSFAREQVGARDVVLCAHMGWNGKRARGSSSLEDWADSNIYLTREGKDGDETDETLRRFFKADGRDVSVDEDEIAFDPSTRALTLTGKGPQSKARASEKLSSVVDAVVSVVRERPGINRTELAVKVTSIQPAGHSAIVAAVEEARVAGRITVVTGATNNAKRHWPAGVLS